MDGTKDERRAAASLLRVVARGIHESTWWRHGCAVDARGIPCAVGDARAVRFDVRGHLVRALQVEDDHGARVLTEGGRAELERLEAAILETVNERGDHDWRSVHDWNDADRMCAWKVRKALRATARRLEGRASDTCRVCGAWARIGPEQWCQTCRDDYEADQAMDGPEVAW